MIKIVIFMFFVLIVMILAATSVWKQMKEILETKNVRYTVLFALVLEEDAK